MALAADQQETGVIRKTDSQRDSYKLLAAETHLFVLLYFLDLRFGEFHL